MSKLVHLLVAGAVVTGAGAAITTGAVAGSASPAMACSVGHQSSPEIRYADSLPTLKYGSHGSTVLGRQMYLRQQGLTYLNGTGNFGANTRQAVRHFQARHNLPVIGVVTATTWRHIITSQYHLPIKGLPNPQLSPGQSLQGPRGEQLENLTMRLNQLPLVHVERQSQALPRSVAGERAGIPAPGGNQPERHFRRSYHREHEHGDFDSRQLGLLKPNGRRRISPLIRRSIRRWSPRCRRSRTGI